MNVPEKHRAIAHAWVEGAEIEEYEYGEWNQVYSPVWYEVNEYRVKIAKVKKWRWVFLSNPDGLMITDNHLSDAQARISSDMVQKIDNTMIEVDE